MNFRSVNLYRCPRRGERAVEVGGGIDSRAEQPSCRRRYSSRIPRTRSREKSASSSDALTSSARLNFRIIVSAVLEQQMPGFADAVTTWLRDVEFDFDTR